MLRHDRKLAEDRRQFAVALLIEGESHVTIAGLFGARHMAVIAGEKRIKFLGFVEAEDDVLRRHRLAVSPFRLRPQTESGAGNIVRIGNALGEQSIGGGDLVVCRFQKSIEDQAGTQGNYARNRIPLEQYWIERVECAVARLLQLAALRRIRIDIIEMLEARLVFEVAENGRADAELRFFGLRGRWQGQQAKRERPSLLSTATTPFMIS